MIYCRYFFSICKYFFQSCFFGKNQQYNSNVCVDTVHSSVLHHNIATQVRIVMIIIITNGDEEIRHTGVAHRGESTRKLLKSCSVQSDGVSLWTAI